MTSRQDARNVRARARDRTTSMDGASRFEGGPRKGRLERSRNVSAARQGWRAARAPWSPRGRVAERVGQGGRQDARSTSAQGEVSCPTRASPMGRADTFRCGGRSRPHTRNLKDEEPRTCHAEVQDEPERKRLQGRRFTRVVEVLLDAHGWAHSSSLQ